MKNYQLKAKIQDFQDSKFLLAKTFYNVHRQQQFPLVELNEQPFCQIVIVVRRVKYTIQCSHIDIQKQEWNGEVNYQLFKLFLIYGRVY
jgi:hypothetical protein